MIAFGDNGTRKRKKVEEREGKTLPSACSDVSVALQQDNARTMRRKNNGSHVGKQEKRDKMLLLLPGVALIFPLCRICPLSLLHHAFLIFDSFDDFAHSQRSDILAVIYILFTDNLCLVSCHPEPSSGQQAAGSPVCPTMHAVVNRLPSCCANLPIVAQLRVEYGRSFCSCHAALIYVTQRNQAN